MGPVTALSQIVPPTLLLLLLPLQNNQQMFFLYPTVVLPIFRPPGPSASTSNEPVMKVLPKKKLQCSLFSKFSEYNFLHLIHLESGKHVTESKKNKSLGN